MCKLLAKAICILVIILAIFIAASLYSGGKEFRWFGKKVKEQSEKIGEKADNLKEKSESVIKGVEEAKEKVKDITGKKDEKSN